MRKIICLLLIATALFQVYSQKIVLNDEKASQFVQAMINNSDSIEIFILPEELAISKRLGITYETVKHKFLISYEMPQQITEGILNGEIKYSFNIKKVDSEYSILNFEITDKRYTTKYYFKNGFLISPPYYYYKDWQKNESEYFIFYVSEPEHFNQYAIMQLENFVKNMFTILNFTDEEKELLKKEKLIYILCKDEDEIEKLTGYKARGLSNLAYDYIITTYNCHYHELLHILMNFKLRKLPLYTHPLLQEGFAVAFGGRGGYEPGIMMNLGKFLELSEFLKVNNLLTANEYKTYDVSMSYPLSGLYNLFLINEIGIDEYYKLYIEYSSINTSGLVIDNNDLPSDLKWNDFVNNYSNEEEIKIDFENEGFHTLIMDSTYNLKMNDSFYLFETKENILISTYDGSKIYLSKIFNEAYPDKKYNGEKYLIKVTASEVAVYNLYNNNLIANYVSGFSTEMKSVPNINGYYKFLINRAIFDEQSNEWQIKTGIKND
jgi:hypothetical protein